MIHSSITQSLSRTSISFHLFPRTLVENPNSSKIIMSLAWMTIYIPTFRLRFFSLRSGRLSIHSFTSAGEVEPSAAASYSIMKDSNNRLECAIGKGLRYLETLFEKNPWAFSSTSYTKDRISFTDNYDYKFTGFPETFTHFLALDLLGKHLSPFVRSKLVDSLRPSKLQTLNYFVDPSIFPDDVDTTVLGYTTLLRARVLTEEDVLPVAETVFGNVDDNGIVELHFKPAEERRKKTICACVCANVLHLAYTLRQESKLQKTENYVLDWLESGKWKSGTLYYPSGFPFLYYCSNFVRMNYKVQRRFRPVLLSAIKNSLKDCRLPLDYALLLLALENLGERDYSNEISEILLGMQEDDGSYAPDAIWGDRHGVLYGGRAFSTIMILGALAAAARFC